MERVNFQAVERKWQKNSQNLNLKPKGKNFIVWKCFHIPPEKYTWAMLEIILSVML